MDSLKRPKQLEVNKVYWVAGRGPMRLTELPAPPLKITITMETAKGKTYWISKDELSLIKPETLEFYMKQLESRLKPVVPSDDAQEFQEQMERLQKWTTLLAV